MYSFQPWKNIVPGQESYILPANSLCFVCCVRGRVPRTSGSQRFIAVQNMGTPQRPTSEMWEAHRVDH